MRAWFVLFVISIGVGGAFAILVALSRTPYTANYLPGEFFAHWLVGHVDLALIFGLYSFLIFLWHRVFGAESRSHEFIPALAGMILIAYSAALGLGKAVLNNYFPTILHPAFFAGAGLIGLSILLTSLRFLFKMLRPLNFRDPVRIVLSGTVILSLALIVSLLLSLRDYNAPLEPQILLERIYWFPGHINQFVNAGLLIAVWFLLARLNQKKISFLLGIISLGLVPFPVYLIYLQIYGVDSLSAFAHRITTMGYQIGIGVPTVLLSLMLLLKGAWRGGIFGKILGLSILIYLIGSGMGYLVAGFDLTFLKSIWEGFSVLENLMGSADARVPAHYHAVLASILLGIMGLSYYFLKDLRYVFALPSLIKWQPLLFGLGMILFSVSLYWAGYYGAPRKTPGTEYMDSTGVSAFMALMGAGSVLSVFSGVIYVLYLLKSIIFSRK